MRDDLLLFYAPNGCSLGSIVVCEWLVRFALAREAQRDVPSTGAFLAEVALEDASWT